MKRILPLLLTLVLLIQLPVCLSSCSEPEYSIVSEGLNAGNGLIYSLYEDGSALITGGNAPENGILIIPEAVDGHKIRAIADFAFEGKNDFFALIIEGAPKSIGRYAFSSCEMLTYADLGKTASLADGCFSQSINLTECKNASSVISIGSSAFFSCISLTRIDLSKKLKSIGDSAFEGCSSLAYFTVPSSVGEFGSNVFSGCSSLAYCDISALGGVPDGSFTKCTSLVYPVIGKATYIGVQAFRGCVSLETIYIPKTVKNIASDAFSGSAVTEIDYGGSVSAFDKIKIESGNDELTSLRPYPNIKMPALLDFCSSAPETGYTSVAFVYAEDKEYNADGFSFFLDSEGNAQITGVDGDPSSVTVPQSVGGHPVVSIGEYAFGDKHIQSVTIGDNITSIDTAAFMNCSSLSTVTGGKNVRSVGYNAFYGTPWYDSVSTGEFTVQFDSVLIGCKNTKNYVIIPDGVKTIGGGVFTTDDRLVFAYLPDSVKTIDSQAFAFCSSLKLVRAASVAELCTYAFTYDTELTYVEFSSLVVCRENAISDCHKLKSADLGDRITEITGSVFYNDQNLRLVYIGKNVTMLTAEIYNSCMTLINVYYGTAEEFKSICIENGSNYLSDMILIPLNRGK